MLELVGTMLPAVVADALNSQNFAYASTATAALQCAWQTLLPNRLRKVADIWVEVVGPILKDVPDSEQQEELVSMVDCFLQVGRKGAAEANLRLLARVVVGQKVSGALKASEFLYYADIIASLRREEIILLGTLKRKFVEATEKKEPNPPGYAQKSAMDELISAGIFESEWDFKATAGAVTRTGLLLSQPVYGGNLIQLTPLYSKFESLTLFEEFLKEAKLS